MTTPRAWLRRLDFRFAEVTHFLPNALREDPALKRPADFADMTTEAVVDHARALWRIALSMSYADRRAVLALRAEESRKT